MCLTGESELYGVYLWFLSLHTVVVTLYTYCLYIPLVLVVCTVVVVDDRLWRRRTDDTSDAVTVSRRVLERAG